MTISRLRTIVTGIAAAGLIAAVCSAGAAQATSAAAAKPPAASRVSSDNGVPIAAKLTRIISLSPTATEMLFAIGAGRQVIAVDDQSDYPANAPRTSLSGYNLNIEAVAAKRPDLVVLSYDPTPNQTALSAFASLRIPVLMHEAAFSLQDSYNQITELCAVTGRTGAAARLVGSMKSSIAGTIKSRKATKRITVFHEIDNTLYSATSDTFIGRVYSDLGLVNIADAAATADSYGYPQLSSEYVVKSNPDIIILTDADYGESARSVAARPGWRLIGAVKNSRVYPVSASVSSRWGPRIVEFYISVGRVVAAINKAR